MQIREHEEKSEKPDSSNILITTLGTSWQIVPELYAFTNPNQLELYAKRLDYPDLQALRTRHEIEEVGSVWVITTEAMQLDALRAWANHLDIDLQVWWPKGVDELSSAAENERMADLIYRVVLHAHAQTKGGNVFLSLAGGRKTMSAEMQQAGMLFGCDALLHVVDKRCTDEQRKQLEDQDLFRSALTPELARLFQPLVIMGHCPANAALSVNPPVCAAAYPLPPQEVDLEPELYAEIQRRLKQAESLMFNFSVQVSGGEKQSNFHGLYTLPPERINQLKHSHIAVSPDREPEDKQWLKRLPKTDLHCHLGGVLDAVEILEVAHSMEDEVAAALDSYSPLAQRINELKNLVAGKDPDKIRQFLRDDPGCAGSLQFLRSPRSWHPHEPIGVCAFVLEFAQDADLLDRVVFGDYLRPASYHGIGIEQYEPLGDLQGSGLLQAEKTLRAVCRVLRRKTLEHNISYLELRCSPNNYTRGDLSAQDVVNILMDELINVEHCTFRLLFIASRHRLLSEAYQHIELAEQLLKDSTRFRQMFVGFDLAGDETARSPGEMRSAFLPLLKRCIPITIHAGEDQNVDNIWEAVYELNADRVGHGLTLGDNFELLKRFVERRIAVEMCPSSNAQVVGYRDYILGADGREYPLAAYLDRGLRVTVNTDNPGISRTDISTEYYKAASMSADGLSRWQVLQLVRNGFQAALCSLEERRELVRAAERNIVEILTNTYGGN